jgi:hypothetical protein
MSDEMDAPIDITAALQQRLAWDIIPCDVISNYWETLDLVPPQEDVAEMAHQESHKRMMTVAPLLPAGEVFVILATDIISHIMISNMSSMDADEQKQAVGVMVAQNREVVRGAFYPILAHMLESGYIQLGPNAAQPIG